MTRDSSLAALGRTMLAQAGVQVGLAPALELEAVNKAPARTSKRSAARRSSKRSAATPGPTPGPAAARRCPVGWCVPHTGTAAPIGIHEGLCERHRLKLSGPLLKQLEQLVRADERRAPELEVLLREAIIEARRRDSHWRPFGVHWRWEKSRWWHRDDRGEGRVLEGFFAERDAIGRASVLDTRIGTFVTEVCLLRTVGRPTPTFPWVGERWSSAAIRVWVAHEVLDQREQVLAHGPTLSAALIKARAGGHWFPAAVRNRITGQRLALDEAKVLLERERNAACSG